MMMKLIKYKEGLMCLYYDVLFALAWCPITTMPISYCCSQRAELDI